jgi:hypothetical protein
MSRIRLIGMINAEKYKKEIEDMEAIRKLLFNPPNAQDHRAGEPPAAKQDNPDARSGASSCWADLPLTKGNHDHR